MSERSDAYLDAIADAYPHPYWFDDADKPESNPMLVRTETCDLCVVGGCCGTTPEHIRQIRLAVQAQVPSAARATESGAVAPAGRDRAEVERRGTGHVGGDASPPGVHIRDPLAALCP